MISIPASMYETGDILFDHNYFKNIIKLKSDVETAQDTFLGSTEVQIDKIILDFCMCNKLFGNDMLCCMDTATWKILRHVENSDTRVGHVSDTTRLLDRSVRATYMAC